MSFGFGIGDFIAIGGVALKIADTLRGARSEYQELVRELDNLQKALCQVDKLKGRGAQAIAVDQIKCAALTCRHPLEDFLAKISKYEKDLSVDNQNGKIKTATRKVQYAFKRKKEADTLRSYLNIHIGTINMLLLRQGLEMLDVVRDGQDEGHDDLRDRIEDSARGLREVRGNTEAQALAVRENSSLLHKLFWMVSSDVAAPLKALSQAVAKVCVSTQQIYSIVLEIRTSLSGVNTRFTFFQEPARVEDVLGRVFPFPSECSVEALNAEIKARFKRGIGKAEVMAGDFEIFNAKNSDQVLTTSDSDGLLPGMSIYMAIVLENVSDSNEMCPMPRCTSTSFVHAVGGGKTCSECNVWFDKGRNKRKREYEEETITKHIESLAGRESDVSDEDEHIQDPPHLSNGKQPAEASQLLSAESSTSAFKRIRLDEGLQSLPMEDLVKLYDKRRYGKSYSKVQERELLRQILPKRSKWANESRIGQRELYETTDFVLTKLISNSKQENFGLLVEINEKNAPNYYDVIEHPMDLSTMMEKLKRLMYTSKQEIEDDIYLIWANLDKYRAYTHPTGGKRPSITLKMASGYLILIPNKVVRDRAVIEAEERRRAPFVVAGDSDEEPIPTSRGGMGFAVGGDSDEECDLSSRGRMTPSALGGDSDEKPIRTSKGRTAASLPTVPPVQPSLFTKKLSQWRQQKRWKHKSIGSYASQKKFLGTHEFLDFSDE